MIKTVNLHKQGLELFLGATEARILSTLWDQENRAITKRRLWQRYVKAYPHLAPTSIYTTINRMTRKGLLIRIKHARLPAVYHTPWFCEDDFINASIHSVVLALNLNYDSLVRLTYEYR